MRALRAVPLGVPAVLTALSLALVVGCSSDDGGDEQTMGSTTTPAVASPTGSAPAPTNTFTVSPVPSATPAVPTTPAATAAPPATTAPATTAPAVTSAPPAASAPTRAQLAKVAAAVNLKAADLPGFTGTPASQDPPTAAERRAQKTFFTCLGFPTTNDEPGIDSPDFKKGADLPSLEISSSVSRDDPTLNVRSVQAFATDKGVACFEPFFREALRQGFAGQPGISVSGIAVAKIAVSKGRADAAAGVRASAVAKAQGLTIPITFDFVVAAEQGYAASLTAVGVQTKLTTAQRTELVGTITSRLAAAAAA